MKNYHSMLRRAAAGNKPPQITVGVSDPVDFLVSGFGLFSNVAYGGGLFVACGDSGFTGEVPFIYSNDGEAWSQATNSPGGITIDWQSITYGNGIFAAVNPDSDDTENYVIGISPDGDSWSAVNTGIASGGPAAIGYANGRFVLLASVGFAAGIAVYYSDDNCQTWNAGSLSYSGNIADLSVTKITFGNGLFVAPVGFGGFFYSSDGINWSSSTASTANGWNRIAYGNGLFVAIAHINTDQVAVSSNGVDWVVVSIGISDYTTGIGFVNGRFLIFANPLTLTRSQVSVHSSADAQSWTEETSPTYLISNDVDTAASNSRLVAVAGNNTETTILTVDVTP